VSDFDVCVVDPSSTAFSNRLRHQSYTDLPVMVATNGEKRSDVRKRTGEISEMVEFGHLIDQVATEQNHIDRMVLHRLKKAFDQPLRAAVSQVDVAYVQEPAGVCRTQDLLTDAEGAIETNFEPVAE
jgi:hypothetical protein